MNLCYFLIGGGRNLSKYDQKKIKKDSLIISDFSFVF